MTTTNFKMTVSVIVGFIGMFVLAIIAGHNYGRGGVEWLKFIVDNASNFMGITVICFGVLCIWQFAGNSFWSFKNWISRLWKSFCNDMQD